MTERDATYRALTWIWRVTIVVGSGLVLYVSWTLHTDFIERVVSRWHAEHCAGCADEKP